MKINNHTRTHKQLAFTRDSRSHTRTHTLAQETMTYGILYTYAYLKLYDTQPYTQFIYINHGTRSSRRRSQAALFTRAVR